MPISRTPPKRVREKLRKEVNFGCPIPNCGSPYLMYHHFDPPWRKRYHHNPEGMIALCRDHAPEADEGAWTKEQIKTFKKNPHIKTGEIEGRFNWLRRDIICIPGNIIHRPQTILKLGEEKAIWMKRDTGGFYRLNMKIRDTRGKIILRLTDNDWLIKNEQVMDIACPPSGKELSIVSKDGKIDFQIRFDDLSTEEFKKKLERIFDGLKTVSRKWEKQREKESTKEISKRLRKEGKSQAEIEEEIRFHKAWLRGQRKIIEHSLEEMSRQRPREIVSWIGNPERVTLCTLMGRLVWKNRIIEIKEGRLKDERENIIAGGFISGAATAFHFDALGSTIVASSR